MSERDELINRIAGRRVVASISGGKDSAATRLLLREWGIEAENVHFFTGWEGIGFLEYLRGPLTEALGPIKELRAKIKFSAIELARIAAVLGRRNGRGEVVEVRYPRVRAAFDDSPMVQLCLKKGMFPSRLRRWCTDLLKIQPFKEYVESCDEEVVSVVGIRRDESEARSRMVEWEWSNDLDCWVCRPVLDFTLQQVIDIHARHGLRPNPLYLQGEDRVGCRPCIFAVKAEIRRIAEFDPEQAALLAELEQAVTEIATLLVGERGETLESERTWFQARIADANGKYPPMPIAKVIEWSRTSRGGKQFEMFAADPADAGCMRWGLCDTNGEGK